MITTLGAPTVSRSVCPRPIESDPGALKVPFFHNNDDYDEMIFYHRGSFFSRDNIHPGMVTLHPCGFPHGPHPKAFATGAKAARKETDEVAVMVDTHDALDTGPLPEGVEWPGQVRKASPVPPPVSLPAARAEPAKPKDDRLTLNRSANPKLDALGAAMANLEGGMAERDRVQGELVSAAGQTVQSIMDIRKVQTEHLAMLERVQKNLSETIRTMEEDRANRIGLTGPQVV